MPFTVLITTAGRSRRMGTPKAWLELDGESLLARIVSQACRGGAMAVVVVAGAEAEEDPSLVSRIEIATRIETPEEVRLSVAIGEPDGELIDSLRAGLGLVQEGADVLLWPVDAPFGDAALVRALAEALGTRRDRIAVPTVGGERGHPVLIGEQVAEELFDTEADEGAHRVIGKDAGRVIEVQVTDERILAAVNTPEEARGLGITVP